MLLARWAQPQITSDIFEPITAGLNHTVTQFSSLHSSSILISPSSDRRIVSSGVQCLVYEKLREGENIPLEICFPATRTKLVSAYGLHLWRKLSQNPLKPISDILRPFFDIIALVQTNPGFAYPVGLTHKSDYPLSISSRRARRCSRDNVFFKFLVCSRARFDDFLKKMDDCVKGERAEFAVEMDNRSGRSAHDRTVWIRASWRVYSSFRVLALSMKVGFENGVIHAVVTTLVEFIL